MVVVKSSKLGKLPLSTFQQVVKNILTQAADSGIADDGLIVALKAVRKAYEDLDKVMQPAQGSTHTKHLLELDVQRDNLVRGLMLVLRGYALSTTAALADAARVLLRYMSAYGDEIANQAQLKETATINNMLQDFDKPDVQAAAALLPLADWKEPLKQANQQFESLYSVRAADLYVPDIGLAKKYRAVVQARLDDYAGRLNATLLLASTPDPTQERVAEMINTEVKTAKENVKKGGGKDGGEVNQ